MTCCSPARDAVPGSASPDPVSPGPAGPGPASPGLANPGTAGPTLAAPGQIAPTVQIPATTFTMGTAGPMAYLADGEQHLHEVAASSFEIGIHAVTNARFAEFIAATDYKTEAERFGWAFVFGGLLPDDFSPTRGVADAPWWRQVYGASWAHPEGPQSTIADRQAHPVVQVSHNDALTFCEWENSRLPTEAEWELAARGGLADAIFPWGDELEPRSEPGVGEPGVSEHSVDKPGVSEHSGGKHSGGEPGGSKHSMNVWQGSFPDANTCADGYYGTAPVDAFEPNGYGLFNVCGNVWEWCADWFAADYYPQSPSADPTGPSTGQERVMRGGSYLCHATYCHRYRVGARSSNGPDSAAGNLGFRTARNCAS